MAGAPSGREQDDRLTLYGRTTEESNGLLMGPWYDLKLPYAGAGGGAF